MRKTFIDTLTECAELDDRIILITADLGYTVVEKFADRFPDRFFNVGIQEQNAVSVAAGLALSGKIVYVYTIIPFVTMRCYEQIRVDVAYMNTQVRLVGVGAGYSYGSAGATHHGTEDIALMRSLPNMTILAPGDLIETRALVKESTQYQGPIYIRLGRGGEPDIHQSEFALKIGPAVEISAGKQIQILTTSNMLETGQSLVTTLRKQGVDAGLTSYPTIKPFDGDYVKGLIQKKIPIVTLEEHVIQGGLGSAVAEIIAESNVGIRFRRFGIPDAFTHTVGSRNFICKSFGLDTESLEKQILGMLE